MVWQSVISFGKNAQVTILDSGLLGVLLDFSDPLRQRNLFGQLLESFVFAELRKQITWAEGDYALFYYRDKDQYEVDFVVENSAGELIGIEVKASASVSISDLAGLKRLESVAPQHFKAGIILYDGTETLPLGRINDRPLWAMPIATLSSSRKM